MKKMNKLFSKVATLSVGLAMAIGVGVAVGSRSVRVARADSVATWDASKEGFTQQQEIAGNSYNFSDESVTISFGEKVGSNGHKYYSPAIRSYGGNSFTIACSSGNMTAITLSNDQSKTVTASVGTLHGNEWTGDSASVTFTVASGSGNFRTSTVSVTFSGGSVDPLESITVSGSMSKTSYTTAQSWSPAGLVATGHYESGADKDVTSSVTWSYNPAAPAVSVTSVVATASIGTISGSSSAQAVTVTVAHAGTAEDPFTVAEALKKCTEIGAVGNKGQGPWVTKGIITKVTSAPAATYWNATYYISDDGSETNELQVYRGFYLNNVQFNEETALLLKVGKVATITGNLTGSYGSEYCQGNYLLALEDQETGDVDVVFEPSETSIEIGATGTYTATSNTAGVVFTWSSDNPDVLSVDETTGEFEALALGVAKITVTATANDKVGSTYANITVNGNSAMKVDEAVALAATIPSGQTTSYYVYVEGFVKEFATSLKDSDPSKPRALDIMSEDESAKIMVYTNVDPYANFVEGLNLGDRIVVKANVQNYNGTYELTSPEKISSAPSAITFAFELLEQTDGQCATYIDNESDYDEFKAFFEGKWSDLKTLYNSLSSGESGEKAKVASAERNESGTTLEQAVARYDFLTGKYQLDNFVEGRTPIVHVGAYSNMALEGNPTILIVIAIATASTLAFSLLLVFKKKKQK